MSLLSYEASAWWKCSLCTTSCDSWALHQCMLYVLYECHCYMKIIIASIKVLTMHDLLWLLRPPPVRGSSKSIMCCWITQPSMHNCKNKFKIDNEKSRECKHRNNWWYVTWVNKITQPSMHNCVSKFNIDRVKSKECKDRNYWWYVTRVNNSPWTNTKICPYVNIFMNGIVRLKGINLTVLIQPIYSNI